MRGAPKEKAVKEKEIKTKDREGKKKEKEGKKKEKKKKEKVKENVEDAEEGTVKKSKSKSKSKSKTKEKTEKKDKDKEKDKDRLKSKSDTLRLSSSSFEIGTASPMPPRTQTETQTLGKKKRSILGLGLPSGMSMTMRLRSGSSASSTIAKDNANTNTVPNIPIFNPHAHAQGPVAGSRLSVESAALMFSGTGRNRAGSSSTASSLRPMSVTSSVSGVGSRMSSGSGGSVRWDEERLESVVAARRRERMEREREKEREREMEREREKEEGGKKDKKGSGKSKSGKQKEKEKEKDSRRSSDSRRRTPLSEVFPRDMDLGPESSSPESARRYPPILTVESATSDGHSAVDDESLIGGRGSVEGMATPVKKARSRPLSEQMFGKERPRGMYESEDGLSFFFFLSMGDFEFKLLFCRCDVDLGRGDERSGAVDQ
jgi:hypothetical protein